MAITLEPEGMLIVLSSPSGGGKSSICRALLDSDPQLAYSISSTSRPPRLDEIHGKDYYFLSEEEFHRLIEAEALYEWAKVHDNYYGTSREIVDAALAQGKDIVMDLDVAGGLNIKKITEKAVLIFVLPPSLSVLEHRLRKRNTDCEEVILKRLINARREINFAQKYDYAVVNEDLQGTSASIRRIIDAERHSSRHQKVKITGEDAEIS
jgi:guanylate kinase